MRMRGFLLVLVLLGIICPVGCGDHYEGYEAGRKAAREARGEAGELGVGIAGAGFDLYPGKIDNKRSAEWNSGFRQGFRDEANR